jgi:hypothetical protein
MEIVETYLELSQGRELFDYLRLNSARSFVQMAHVDRTPRLWQAANLWEVIEWLRCFLRDCLLLSDPTVPIVESMPITLCKFSQAYCCHRFDDTFREGLDYSNRQAFNGSRLHYAVVLTRSDYPDAPG